ncbi:MAG: flagellar hook-length control protein FliK [Proteobacteria bacterium]|nr:flagellar hook-length control protein FliK [Pseudomonadota bacterium]
MRAIHVPPPDPADPSSRQDPAAAAIARAVHQLAEAGYRKGNGTVEIALSPEELGHVRLMIQSHDGGAASVHLSADRQDTLDLMRRHVELLAQDMRDLGYGDLSFSFQDKAQRGLPDFGRDNQQGPPADAPQTAHGHSGAQAGLRAAMADSGLDIRI